MLEWKKLRVFYRKENGHECQMHAKPHFVVAHNEIDLVKWWSEMGEYEREFV